ncbi:MAG TPA: ABC transporter ATP-binding protein [bacterium]|nr:ABC transporter ATP-binding protein [bacterium]
MATVLETKSLYKIYHVGELEVRALDGVDFAAEEGDFISIMGPSGSGKTTLLNLIGCIDRPTGGDVFVSGRAVSSLSDSELDRLRLQKIGFVFQRVNMIPILTAAENVELPMELAGMDRAARRARAKELLDAVGLARRAHHRPAQLSAGEQQRVGIARALANNPDVILADEPTGNLDSQTAAGIMQLLSDLNSRHNQTLIIVTHDPEVGAIAHRALTIRDGNFVLSGHS